MENLGNPAAPEIVVQIVHIDGPRKGQIDELNKDRITIGRGVTSDVCFPADTLIVSRDHAVIEREGNRFLFVHHGKNASLIRGQAVQKAYLKQGDVIELGEGGPKISFLSSIKASPRPPRPPIPEYTERPPVPPPAIPPRVTPPVVTPGAAREPGMFTFQYGVNIRSFKQPSVKLGRDESNNFSIPHPSVYKIHAEISFQQGQYFVRDLTSNHATFVNQRPAKGDALLAENDLIQLGDNGPQLRYLGKGRFVEEVVVGAKPPETGFVVDENIPSHQAFADAPEASGKKNLLNFLFKKKS